MKTTKAIHLQTNIILTVTVINIYGPIYRTSQQNQENDGSLATFGISITYRTQLVQFP